MEKGFLEKDIEKLASLWKGEVSFIEKDHKITMLTVKRRYQLKDSKKDVQVLIDKVLSSSHGYVSVQGDPEGLTVSASVKPIPESMISFRRLAKQLDNE
ncbi:hypothetical protein [Bacillus piscicola]|uniref:hypothetical protein n=1 Tax=Bacillus piscicola TaxID=1632684 RepID=UPI001F0971F4|nr:hypothetical protein [Bacillus piscicola]